MDMIKVQVNKIDRHFKKNCIREKYCENCSAKVNAMIKYTPNEIVAVESGTFTSVYDENGQTYIKPIPLSEIQKSFIYGGIKYELKGVINYLPGNNHFITLVLRNKVWAVYDDLKPLCVFKPKVDLNSIRASSLFYVRAGIITEDSANMMDSGSSTGKSLF